MISMHSRRLFFVFSRYLGRTSFLKSEQHIPFRTCRTLWGTLLLNVLTQSIFLSSEFVNSIHSLFVVAAVVARINLFIFSRILFHFWDLGLYTVHWSVQIQCFSVTSSRKGKRIHNNKSNNHLSPFVSFPLEKIQRRTPPSKKKEKKRRFQKQNVERGKEIVFPERDSRETNG